MKRLMILSTGIVFFLVLGLAVWPAHAQSPDIVTAEVDRTNLTTDDSLVLTVLIDSGAGPAEEPTLPQMDGLTILGRSHGTQMSIVNGEITVKATYLYRLQPTNTGNLVIEPITVNVNGHTHQSDPITITVIPGNGSPTAPPSQPSSPFGSR